VKLLLELHSFGCEQCKVPPTTSKEIADRRGTELPLDLSGGKQGGGPHD
jgi:hypothetical protein